MNATIMNSNNDNKIYYQHSLNDSFNYIGDLALIGAPIIGHFSGSRTNHQLNNILLHKLMAIGHAW